MSANTSAIVQATRLLELDTPLARDLLLIEHCTASEAMSGLYSLELDLLLDLQKHKASEVKPEDLLGRKMTLALQLASGHRFFNGIVKRFSQRHHDSRFQYYRAEIVPWTWLLTLKSNCRIFQRMSIPEIVKKVFDKLKADYSDLVAYRDALSGKYVQWDYCVQYRETDFNFISRLLEQAGIYYFFEHERNGHTLVLADANSTMKACGAGKYRYQPEGGFGERLDTVSYLTRVDELRPGKCEFRDYHFEMPSKTLDESEATTFKVANNVKLNLYDYPGEYAQPFNKPAERLGDVERTGEGVARLRMQEEEVAHQMYTGVSNIRDFVPGYQFEVTEHKEMAGKYALVSVQHKLAQSPGYISGQENDNPYENSFVCTPFAVPYRPRRVTPKPTVQGPQTAVVVGKSGEEIWVDKYGRVKVQFFWDREGKKDEDSSCWVRVSQPWAGKGWGGMWIPRIGQEVIVDFLEGDPDQPIITGRVYNSAQTVPYELPGHQTVSTMQSRSSKGGGTANYNELRFEDKQGAEQIFLNAERDMDARVEHDSREYIGNDRHLIVHNNQLELVEVDKHGHVKGNHMEQVEKDMSLHVAGNLMEKIDQDMSHEVGQNRMEKVGSDMSVEVGSNRMEKVGSNLSIKVGSDCKEDIGASRSLSVGSSNDEKVGTKYAVDAGQEIHLKGGMKVIIEAGMQLSLKSAGGFVDIGPAGVTIQGIMVKINSGGAAGSGSGASPKSPDSPQAPKAPVAPTDPDTADDGSKFDKL